MGGGDGVSPPLHGDSCVWPFPWTELGLNYVLDKSIMKIIQIFHSIIQIFSACEALGSPCELTCESNYN